MVVGGRFSSRLGSSWEVPWRDWRSCYVSIGLHSLLESSHLLNSKHLSTPLLIDRSSLFTLNFKLFSQPFFLLLQLLDFFLKFLNLFVCLFALFTL